MKNLICEIDLFLLNSNYAENTKNRYKQKLKHFSLFLSTSTDTPVEELHLQKIYETYDINDVFIKFSPINTLLIDEYFESKINNGYSCLKDNRDAIGAFFNYLNRNYDFPNLMKEINTNIKSFKLKNKKVDILSKHDILKLFHTIVSISENLVHDLLLFTLFLTTGCRLSEIANLKINNIYWEENSIFISKTKHNKSRIIPLRNDFSSSIMIYCKNRKNLQSDDKLFDLSQTEMRNLFYVYTEKANLPRVHLHSLRHTFATMMIESGAIITEVQQLLGHSDVITTKGYVHPNLTRNKSITIKENDEIFRFVKKNLKN